MYLVRKLIIILVVLTALFLQSKCLLAASLSMEELREQFKEETGKEWNDVTSDERRDFLYQITGREKKEERQERVEGIKVPFFISEGFLRDKGMEWEYATEEEQTLYVEEWKIKTKEREQLEKKRLLEEARREKEIEREKKIEQRKALEIKRQKERKVRDKERKLKQKRDEEKRKLKDAKRKMDELRKKSKQRHN